MTSRHYDVVVAGRSLGALTTAALLARRDFSVLLVGQGQRSPSYTFDGYELKRRAFSLLFGQAPVWRRILHDLAQSQIFRRRERPVEPMFSVASPARRLAVSSRPERFEREISREFPEVRQLVDELYSRLADANSTIDQAFSRDVVWPPTTFVEKMEASRVTAMLPFQESGAEDLLAKFPAEHPYRDVATIPAVFAADTDYALSGLSPVAFSRLSGAWLRGLTCLKNGEDELEEFLLERFRAHGGTCWLEQKLERVLLDRGQVRAVELDSSDAPVGTDAVVTSLSGEAMAELTGGKGITKAARDAWPRVTPTAGRFVVSLLVKQDALPVPLTQETFLLPPESHVPNPRNPVIRLQRSDDPSVGADAPSKCCLLVAEALLPAEGTLSLREARHAILETLRLHLPFIDEHLVMVDSPHDGQPLQDYRSGVLREIDRIHIKQSQPEPEFMEHQWTVEPQAVLGLRGEPVRGPIAGTFLVGKTTLPALGQEGELIAAWNVARILTRKDSTRQRLRRQLWTKIETG